MKKLFVVAALLLASSAAQAQYTFEYGGRTIRIDPDRGTVSIPGVYDNSGRRSKRSHSDQDSDRPRKSAPEQAKIDPPTPPPSLRLPRPLLRPRIPLPLPSLAPALLRHKFSRTPPPPRHPCRRHP